MKKQNYKRGYSLSFGHNILPFIYLVLGLVLLIKPAELTHLFCVILGITALLYGGVRLFLYYQDHKEGAAFRMDLMIGVILLIIGIISLVKSEIILSILPFILGIVIVLDSIRILQHALGLRKLLFEQWWISLIMAFVLLILGIVLITNPFGSTLLFVRFLGFVLIADGCSDIWGNYQYYNHM
nr:DUF308 domain-containing protein [uncultured Sellimonas sp.]